MSRRALTTLVLGLVIVAGVLALAAPANAAPPTGKKYTVDFFGANINSPFDLLFVGLDCVTFFTNGVACAPLLFNDCGPYRITGVDGSVTHFEVDFTAKIGSPGAWFFYGPVTLVGTVDRFGAGSAFSASGNGKLRSNAFVIPPTKTNMSVHGIEGCAMAANPNLKPADNWIRNR